MLSEPRTDAGLLTRARWAELLLHFGDREWESRRHPKQRRRQPRYRIPAVATLTLQAVTGDNEPRVYPACQVLDASASGLAVRSYQRIANGTVAVLEVSVGDRRLVLSGHVATCTGFPGCFRVGFALHFADAE